MRLVVVLAGIALLGGCPRPGGAPSIPCNDDGDCARDYLCRAGTCAPGEGMARPDAGAPDDAGGSDAPDGGAPGDAGAADAGIDDAGLLDAGVADAGAADAGTDDAGLLDAGVDDAGLLDAGPVDTAPCGSLHVLADDFEDPALPPHFGRWSDSTAAIAEVGGELRVEVPAGAQGYAGYFTRAAYSLAGASVSVEAVEMPSASSADAWFGFDVDDYSFHVTVSAGRLGVARQLGSPSWDVVDLGPYSPTAHRHWRLGEVGGAVRFEVSADGSGWQLLHTAPVGAMPTRVRVAFGGGTSQAGSAATVVRVDDVNGGVATAGWCPVRDLGVDFSAPPDDVLFSWTWPTCSVETVGGQARVLCAEGTSASSGAGFSSLSAYDLRDQTVTLEVIDPSLPTPSAGLFFKLQFSEDDDKLEFWLDDGTWYFGMRAGGAETTVGSYTPAGPPEARWLRFRVEAATVRWETSPDGIAWSERARAEGVPLPLEAGVISFGLWTDVALAVPAAVTLDNLNLAP